MNYDLAYMHKVSEEFFETGLQTTEFMFKTIEESTGQHHKIPVAAINLAFSAELALKTISLTEGLSFEHTHKLFDLFGNLSAACQKSIAGIFGNIKTWDRKNFPIVRLRKSGNEDKVDFSGLNENTDLIKKVKAVLEIHDNAFISWRYSFEMTSGPKPSIHFDFSSMLRLDMALLQYLRLKLI